MNSKNRQASSRSDIAYQQLLKAIQHGTLKPGARIREVDIAEQLQISRTPVRDAIRRLESDGLIIHVPRQGAVIKQLDHREIIELYEIREILEGSAARFAARHASSLEIAELEELNQMMLDAADSAAQVADANRMFHASLYRCASNRYLISALKSLTNAMTLLGRTTLGEQQRPLEANQEHQAIIDAIRARDPQRAEKAARAHIIEAQKIRMRMFREHSD